MKHATEERYAHDVAVCILDENST